jgi:hypothetical protein
MMLVWQAMRTPATADRVLEVTSPADLGRFTEQGVAGVIWQRPLEEGLSHWLGQLKPHQIPQTRSVVTAATVRPLLTEVFSFHATPEGPQRDQFAADIVKLVKLFAVNTGSPFVRLRLDAVSTDSCRRFHVDQVPARMLCTYRGRGTQFRVEHGEAVFGQMQEMASGAVAIFRGSRWNPNEPLAVTHRSPPIAGSGETRLLAVLDVAEPMGYA